LQRSLALARAIGERLAEARALLGLSELALASSDPRQAVVLGQQASDVFRDRGTQLYEVRTLSLLSPKLATRMPPLATSRPRKRLRLRLPR
jgi:hypothetical protein